MIPFTIKFNLFLSIIILIFAFRFFEKSSRMEINYMTQNVDMPSFNTVKVGNWIEQVANLHAKRVGALHRISGDMVISLDTVRSNAEQLGVDYSTELLRVIIHGVLHLCGINDKGPGEREIMEQHENEALAILPENIFTR